MAKDRPHRLICVKCGKPLVYVGTTRSIDLTPNPGESRRTLRLQYCVCKGCGKRRRRRVRVVETELTD